LVVTWAWFLVTFTIIVTRPSENSYRSSRRSTQARKASFVMVMGAWTVMLLAR
jgi:hypothetical protein